MNLATLLVPLAIGLIAMASGSLTLSGGISGIFLGYIIVLSQGLQWFYILLLFFVIAESATKYKKASKKIKKLGQGKRKSKHVVANGGVAAFMALLGGPAGLYGFLGALSAAAADTVSSEIGVLSKKDPVMVTTLKKVPPGTNGGMSVLGTTSALLASFILALAGWFLFGVSVVPIALAGFFGHFADSVFGALVENRGLVGNSSTNLVATASGAIVGMIACSLL